jgi:hypothetical protein
MVRIPVKQLREFCDPFESNPWNLESFSRELIQIAIDNEDFVTEPVLYSESRERHIARVAYLVVNPARDPIDIDVGVPSLGCHVPWFICDGNHRFAAAIFLKKRYIFAEVSGSLEYAKELFGVDCEEKALPWNS